MDKEYLKNVLVYVLTAIVSIIIIAYILFSFINGMDTSIETMTADIVTERETVDFDAYILRVEQIITSSYDGGINYLHEDGEKIGVNCTIANIYGEGGSASARSKIIEIDKKINILENSNIADSVMLSDTTALDEKMNELFDTMRYKIECGNIDYAIRKKDELLTLMNKRQIITRSVSDYNSQIDELENEKKSEMSSLDNIVETVVSGVSGYFYAEVDGYESIFAASKISTLTVAEFDEMKDAEPQKSGYNGTGYSIGKIATDYNWYIACETTQDSLKSFRNGTVYTVIFPYSSDTEVKMTLVRIVADPNDGRILLIFKTGENPDNFNFLRRQTVEIVKASYTGYRVPISSVRIKNDFQGVYVLDGNVVKFREIIPLIESNGYFIVEKQDILNDPDYFNKIGLYDMVITKGKNLYDGKIIE